MSRVNDTSQNGTAHLDAAVAGIREALEAGRTARGARLLSSAARRDQAAGLIPQACDAQRLLARLELRRGNDRKALAAARVALRLARKHQAAAEAEAASALVAPILSRLGEHDRAQRHAREWLGSARSRGAASTSRALRALALAAWAGGDQPRALGSAVEARDQASEGGEQQLAAESERLLAVMLLRAGCPTTANRLLTGQVRGRENDPESVPALIARGWSSMCLGKPDLAARDFRRARRLARGVKHRPREIEAATALGAADIQRGQTNPRAPRPESAQEALRRAQEQSRRLKDPRLEQKVRLLLLFAAGAQPDTGTRGFPANRKEAAHALVALSQASDSLAVTEACLLEVQRLARLPADQPPYSCGWALLPEPGG